MIGNIQQTGEKHQHPYRYMRYGRLLHQGKYDSFMVDFLRYENAWIYSESDAVCVMDAASSRWEWTVVSPIVVCKLSDQSRSVCWTPERLLSDWQFEETANPSYSEGAKVTGDKLPLSRRWEHFAKVEPTDNYKKGFPLHLLSKEQASPLREGHSFVIEHLLTPDGYAHEIKVGLRKVTDNKQSDWKFDDWREVGWELTALVPYEVYSVFSH